ncbi:MAG: penicillin-binding protein 1C, partial [Chitinophagia bacterium]|nr:penicillin-binding protein 1C [Chitinophagia bacterium]
TRVFGGQPPAITSLTNGMTYLLLDGPQQQLQLGCTTGNDVQQVYWYINDEFVASAAPGQQIGFTPTTPTVKISCTDDKGRNSNIVVKVNRG